MEWLNYHHLLNFWLVAREGTVRAASELLHVTPASVSVQIKQLERSLGVKLFKKEGRGVALTEMGEQVATYAESIFATGRELMEMVKGRPVGEPMELRVGIRDVMPKLVAFQLLRPALQLDFPMRVVCHEGDMGQLVSALAIHKLDIVLSDTALDPLYKVQAHSYLLGESDVLIVGTRGLANKYRRGFPESLLGAPFLLPMDTAILRRHLDRWFDDIGIAPNVLGEFDDSAMMKIAGRDGLGMLAVPEAIEEDVKQMYGLVRIGIAAGVREQFHGVSIKRKMDHPGVLAIRKQSPETANSCD